MSIGDPEREETACKFDWFKFCPLEEGFKFLNEEFLFNLELDSSWKLTCEFFLANF